MERFKPTEFVVPGTLESSGFGAFQRRHPCRECQLNVSLDILALYTALIRIHIEL